MILRPDWFETFFDALAFDVWAALVPAEHTDAEAAYIRHQLRLQPGDRVLDAPAGDGRLALPMARAGLSVDAFDLAPVAADRLRARAAQAGLDIEVTAADLRRPADWPQRPVQGAYCAGNSFGYVDPAGLATFVAGVADRLPPGGRFIVDYPLVAEVALNRPAAERSAHRSEVGGVVAELELDDRYDVRTSTFVADMVLRHGDVHDRRVVGHRVMTCAQVVTLVEDAGLAVEALHGGIDASPFELGSPGLWLTAVRR